MLCGTYNLDREDARGILVEGRDRPPAILCGHNPPYYPEFFERFGFVKRHDDGLAYAIEIDPQGRRFNVCSGSPTAFPVAKILPSAPPTWPISTAKSTGSCAAEPGPRTLAGIRSLTRQAVAGMLMPLVDLADPDLILFAEVDGKAVGWFPAIQNFNEILIHLNGLRYPWDYVRALRYKNLKPKGLSVKSVAVLPEYWDTGVAILLFAEMARRAIPKGYQWADFSLTGEDNPDTWNIAHHAGATIYKRYRFYKKELI